MVATAYHRHLSLTSIHCSAWKNSAKLNFRFTEFSEVRCARSAASANRSRVRRRSRDRRSDRRATQPDAGHPLSVTDNPCQAPFVPDASHQALVVRELLEGTPYEGLAIFEGAVGIYPRKPRPQVLAVAVGQVGKLLSVPFLE